MHFTSIEFAFFIPLIFVLYWSVFKKNRQQQNNVILVASYFFYGWWDWRFLILILISSLTDYIAGIQIASSSNQSVKKRWLLLSIFTNLGLLGFFKYYNFFIDSFLVLSNSLGIDPNITTLSIILPVGISFYTFQTMAYTIDIYWGKISSEKNLLIYLAYVSFFPQLLAGPIERASSLLPQFHKKRTFDLKLASDGMRQILWGVFCKIVIADTIGIKIDRLFLEPESYSSFFLIQGVFFFMIQVYADFSAYSHIAIGAAKLFGIKLSDNFLFPLFSRNLSEFWKRWHITLFSWFRDYVYIPLGGSRHGKRKYYMAILITFGISGLWHGASWNMIIYGILNGLFYVISLKFISKSKVLSSPAKPSDLISIVITILLFAFPLVVFRTNSMDSAFSYYLQIISLKGGIGIIGYEILLLSVLMLGFEWIQRDKKHALEIHNFPFLVRYSSYAVMIFLISWNLKMDNPFIYFQF